MEQQTELTQLHGRVIDALNLLDYEHEDERLIEVDGQEFQLDCYLPSFHLCIEADGPSHGMRGRKDRRRDALLMTIGIPTLRIRWDLVETETLEGLARHIDRWTVAWRGSVKARRDSLPDASGIRRVPRKSQEQEDLGGL